MPHRLALFDFIIEIEMTAVFKDDDLVRRRRHGTAFGHGAASSLCIGRSTCQPG